MNITFGEDEFVCILQDIIGFKAGLVVTVSRLNEMINSAPQHIRRAWPNPPLLATRMRADEFQEIVSWLLFRVGATPEHGPTTHQRLMLEEASAPPEKRAVYRTVISSLVDEVKRQALARVAAGENPFLDPRPLDMTEWIERCATEGGPEALALALRVVGYVDHDSVAFAWNKIRRVEWRDEAELDSLFTEAGFPPAHGRFFDQRYIDFLSTNQIEIGAIHWRQFERLTAEYFDREGYRVELGPGTDDGGVDVRVWRSDGQGPPFILIQCKRWKDVVQQVHVKALYADVLDENATSGLIVTTSRLEPAAKRWCETHAYKIDSVNRPTLRRWIEQLRTKGE
jgi:restriction system protein